MPIQPASFGIVLASVSRPSRGPPRAVRNASNAHMPRAAPAASAYLSRSSRAISVEPEYGAPSLRGAGPHVTASSSLTSTRIFGEPSAELRANMESGRVHLFTPFPGLRPCVTNLVAEYT